jgi:hypothetical protein
MNKMHPVTKALVIITGVLLVFLAIIAVMENEVIIALREELRGCKFQLHNTEAEWADCEQAYVAQARNCKPPEQKLVPIMPSVLDDLRVEVYQRRKGLCR